MSNVELKDKPLPGQPLLNQIELITQMHKLLEEFLKYIPFLTVENTSDSGTLKIILAGYDGKNFVEKPLKTLNPGESFVATSKEMKNVPALVPTKGTHLLVRVANTGQEECVEFTVYNTHIRKLKYSKGYPHVFPYWGGAMKVLDERSIDKDDHWPDCLLEDQQAAMYYGGQLTE